MDHDLPDQMSLKVKAPTEIVSKEVQYIVLLLGNWLNFINMLLKNILVSTWKIGTPWREKRKWINPSRGNRKDTPKFAPKCAATNMESTAQHLQRPLILYIG